MFVCSVVAMTQPQDQERRKKKKEKEKFALQAHYLGGIEPVPVVDH